VPPRKGGYLKQRRVYSWLNKPRFRIYKAGNRMSEPLKQILVVDDSAINISAAEAALEADYEVLSVESAREMFSLLESGPRPALILLDVLMPEMNGYEAIIKLKSNPATSDIPVIFLTSLSGSEAEFTGLEYGAVDYITKPIFPSLLVKRVSNYLLLDEQKKQLESQKQALKNYNDNLESIIKRQTRAVLDLQYAILATIGNIIEFRDDITGKHNQSITAYLYVFIEGLREAHLYANEIDEWNIPLLCQSAQLHDVGKIAISDIILYKEGTLTDEEFEIMKTHTTLGEKIVDRISNFTSSGKEFLSHARTLAGMHHEHWDGTGYPYGLIGEDIPLAGRLMAIVDVYDALVAARPYKKSFTHEEALERIKLGSGTQFDPTLVEAFGYIAERFKEIFK
jgi:putative two-component system response regulator